VKMFYEEEMKASREGTACWFRLRRIESKTS